MVWQPLAIDRRAEIEGIVREIAAALDGVAPVTCRDHADRALLRSYLAEDDVVSDPEGVAGRALGQAVATGRRRLGISVGGLYAANTFGAALGALSVPFFWLPNLGARASFGACVAGSLFTGVIAWWLDPGEQQLAAATLAKKKPGLKAIEISASSLGALSVLAALSGALLFILQVVWSRMFAQVHENSIYSFSLVVAVLLVGLAAGAALARQLLRLGRVPRNLLGVAWIASGAVVFLTPHLFYSLTDGLSYLKGNGGWASYGLRILWV
jgi:spermidine synthase